MGGNGRKGVLATHSELIGTGRTNPLRAGRRSALPRTRSFARRALVAAVLAQSVGALVVSAPARAATETLTPVADARVQSDQPAKNFGSATTIVADKSPATESFLRFEVTGLTAAPTLARLRLWVTNKSSNGPQVRAVTAAWDEGTVTWNTKPSVGGTVVANVGSVSAGK